MSDDLPTRRKKLRFRAQRRGFKELDLLFGAFAEAHLGALGAEDLDRFEALLAAPDWEVYGWIAGHQPVPAAQDSAVYRMLADYKKTIGKSWNV